MAKVAGGAASKLAKIGTVRKNIARTLTVYNTKVKEGVREAYKGKKYAPKQIRAKKTRAMRRALTPKEAGQKTVKAAKKERHYSKRVIAIKA